MARTTLKTPPEPEETEREARAEELAELNEAEGGDLFNAIDELSVTEGVKVMIIRLTPAENKGYCGDMPVSDFSINTLKARYGAGTYKVRIKGPKGFLPGGGTVSIAADIKPEKLSGASDFVSFQEWQAKRDAENADRRSRMMELLLPSAITGAISLLTAAISRQSGPDVASLITALKPAPGPTMTELTTSLANIQALSKPPDNSGALDSIVKVMEVVKEFGGDSSGGGKTGWLDIVKELINQAGPAVKPILEGLQQQAAARAAQNAAMQNQVSVSVPPEVHAAVSAPVPPIQPVVPPVAQSSAGVAANLSEDEKMYQLFLPLIKDALAQIAGWAEKDKDPELYAEVFVDNLPPGIENYIPQPKALEYIDHPNWWAKVCEVEPRLIAHKDWCEEFRAELRNIISAPPDEIKELKPDPDESGNYAEDSDASRTTLEQ